MPLPDYSRGAAWQRGSYVPIAEASVPLTDWGFLRSDAAYDVVTVWDGAFFRLADHLERFLRSCQRFRLDPGRTGEEITAVLAECVRLAGLRSAYVEMLCTRGQPPWGSRDPRQAVNQFHAFAVPYVWIANEEQRRRGLNVMVSSVQRIPPARSHPSWPNACGWQACAAPMSRCSARADSRPGARVIRARPSISSTPLPCPMCGSPTRSSANAG